MQELHHRLVSLYVSVSVCVWVQYIEGQPGFGEALADKWEHDTYFLLHVLTNHNEAALMISTWIPTSSQLGPIGGN